jgi:hypothetical protein
MITQKNVEIVFVDEPNLQRIRSSVKQIMDEQYVCLYGTRLL